MLDKMLGRMNLFLWMSVVLTVLFPFMALGVRFGLWDYHAAFSLLTGLSITGAVLLAIVGFGLITSINRGNQKAKHSATAAVLILILPLAFVFSNVYKATSLPVIHAISTDFSNPPAFIQAPDLRVNAENTLDWNPETQPLQTAAYPDIQPVFLAVPAKQGQELVKQAIMVLPWELTYHNQETGMFEATSL